MAIKFMLTLSKFTLTIMMSAFPMMAMVVVFRSEDLLECNGDSILDSAHLASVGIWKQPKLFLQILCGASIYTAFPITPQRKCIFE